MTVRDFKEKYRLTYAHLCQLFQVSQKRLQSILTDPSYGVYDTRLLHRIITATRGEVGYNDLIPKETRDHLPQFLDSCDRLRKEWNIIDEDETGYMIDPGLGGVQEEEIDKEEKEAVNG